MPDVSNISLRPSASAKGEYDLMIHGDIGESWWSESVTAKNVVNQLRGAGAQATTINVRINSFGGSVADGLAIYNALREHKARKVVTVDGVAVSCGSLIAMAGDTIRMPATSMMMIHAPWSHTAGNANDLRKSADVLDKWAEAMVSAYVRKTGKTEEEIRNLLTDGEDHWYTGAEAVSAGFADEVISEEAEQTAATKAAFSKASAFVQYSALAAYRAATISPKEAPMEDEVKPAETAPVAAPVEAAPVATPVTNPEAMIAEAVAKAVAAAKAEAAKEIEAVQARLNAEVEARENASAVAFAKEAFANLPGDPAAVGPAIRALRKADAKSAEVIETVLKGANALLAGGKPGTEALGSSAEAQPKSARDLLAEKVAEIKAKNPGMSEEKASVLAYEQNPDLYAALSGGKD